VAHEFVTPKARALTVGVWKACTVGGVEAARGSSGHGASGACLFDCVGEMLFVVACECGLWGVMDLRSVPLDVLTKLHWCYCL